MKNSSGTIVYTNSNITPVSTTALPETDPNFPNSTVYRIVYESGFINQTTFQSATTLENGALIATSCSVNVPIAYLASYSMFIGETSTNPCSRTDKAYLNPPSYNADGTVRYLGSFAGCNASGQCSGISGYALPNRHNIRIVNNTTGTVYINQDIYTFDVITVSSSAIPKGTIVRFEYRNKQVPTDCSPLAPTVSEVYTW